MAESLNAMPNPLPLPNFSTMLSRAMSQSVKSLNFTHSLGGTLSLPLTAPWPMPLLSPRQTPPLTALPPSHQMIRCVVVLMDRVCDLQCSAIFSFFCTFLKFADNVPSFLFKVLSFSFICQLSLLSLLYFFLQSKSSPLPQNGLCALAREHGVISRPLSSP